MKKYENTATKTTTMINKLISHQEIINRCLFLSNDGDEKKRKSDFFTQSAQYEEMWKKQGEHVKPNLKKYVLFVCIMTDKCTVVYQSFRIYTVQGLNFVILINTL